MVPSSALWQTTARALWISISTPIYRNMVIKYAQASGISAEAVGVCVHSMRATAATNALSNNAGIAKVRE
jgi:hypothetical protein